MPQMVPTVDVDDLPDDVTLVDVREDDEWTAGHAPTAVHVPMAQVPERLEELPGDEPLYVICRSGGRSARVVAYLNANGWDAVNVGPGMLGWEAAGRPLVCDQGQPQVL
jgi:rhodanese-related sulfurtransferase